MKSSLDVVIPTLNAAPTLPATLACLREARAAGLVGQIIVVDGGSTDDTVVRAREAGVTVIHSAPGRGGQLRAGAMASDAPWLLFLHADTVLAPGWLEAVSAFIADGDDRAAAFTFALDDNSPAAQRMERLVSWRCRAFKLPYGDQGLLISRALYTAIGGYVDMPLMEDVAIVRAIGGHRIRILDVRATTSAARFRREGYIARPLRNLALLALYFLGVAPSQLARLYTRSGRRARRAS